MSQAYLKHMELVVFTYQHKNAWTIKNKITTTHINQLCKSYPAFYMAPKKSMHYIVESRLWGGHSEPVFNNKIYIYCCRFSTKNTLKNCLGGS